MPVAVDSRLIESVIVLEEKVERPQNLKACARLLVVEDGGRRREAEWEDYSLVVRSAQSQWGG